MQEIDMTQRFSMTHYVQGTPRETWDAWTNPAAIAQWWHLPESSAPEHGLEYDVRVGGSYIYTSINGETGKRSVSGGVFREVVPPHRLVFTWGVPQLERDDLPLVTVEIEETEDGSYVALTLDGFSGEPGDGAFYDIWDQALVRLKEYVASQHDSESTVH